MPDTQQHIPGTQRLHDTAEVARTPNAFEHHYNQIAQPFGWHFTKQDLAELLEQLDSENPEDQTAAIAARPPSR